MRVEIQLDARLSRIARCARRGSVLADVGADHAYLVCHLVARGHCPRGYACDVAPGPLERSKSTIAACGLGDRVRAVLTDGLRGLPMEEIDDIVIAGMGGELIAAILERAPDAGEPDKLFLLQPMTRAEHLRRALYTQGFALKDEHAVESGQFVYTVMEARYTGFRQDVDELFAWTGKLLKKGDAASRLYLRQTAARLDQQAGGLEQSARFAARAAEIRGLAAQIGKRV